MLTSKYAWHPGKLKRQRYAPMSTSVHVGQECPTNRKQAEACTTNDSPPSLLFFRLDEDDADW